MRSILIIRGVLVALIAALSVALIVRGNVVIGVLLLAIGQSFVVAGPLLTAIGVVATLVLLGIVLSEATRRAST